MKHSPPMARTLRVLSHLLRYPDTGLRGHLGELRQALRDEKALSPQRLGELDTLMERIAHAPGLAAEATYVELFDRGRSTSLHLFEHVHGDSRDRGPAMIDLAQTYEKAGLYLAEGELPDHLCVVLEYASTQPAAQACELLRETAHLLRAIFSALRQRESAYASAIAATLDLAGEAAEAVAIAPEADLDQSWSEPPAFDGCSTQGQSRTGQAQPIRIVKRPPPAEGASP